MEAGAHTTTPCVSLFSIHDISLMTRNSTQVTARHVRWKWTTSGRRQYSRRSWRLAVVPPGSGGKRRGQLLASRLSRYQDRRRKPPPQNLPRRSPLRSRHQNSLISRRRVLQLCCRDSLRRTYSIDYPLSSHLMTATILSRGASLRKLQACTFITTSVRCRHD